MSGSHRDSFPKGPLLGAAALVALALVSVSLVRLGGGLPEPPRAEPLVQRDFQFQDRADGGISVVDADSGRLVEVVEPATNGFLRATLRGLARERKRRGVARAEPFRLTARVDGRLTLEDPATGRRVDLEAFGPANAGAFARLLVLNDRPR